MKTAAPGINYSFLAGGGEMGKLTREKDWHNTPVGNISEWPQSLRTTLSILLHSKFPMFLFWGDELTCFYNDAYRPSLGNNGKHPHILGMPGHEAWPEIWSVIHPLIVQVLSGGDASWAEDQLIPIYRNGKIEDVYWTFSYSPVNDESGKTAGVFVTCTETTSQVQAKQQITELEERNRLAIDANDVGVYEKNLLTGKVSFSDKMHQIYGSLSPLPPEAYISMIHPDDHATRNSAHEEALITGKLSYQYRIILPDGNIRWIDSHAKIYYDAGGTPVKRIGTIQDITERKIFTSVIEAAEKKFRNTVMQAPVGIVLMKGPQFVVEMANENYLQLVDKKEQDFVGKPLFDSLPEVKEIVEPLLKGVLTTGIPYYANELEVMLNRFGKKLPASFNLVYQPIREKDGHISGVMAVANEVTAQVLAKHALKESEERFSNIVKQSPIAITTWKGPDFIIEMANEAMLKNIWRKEPQEVIGRKALEIFPELIDQKYPALLHKVYTEGIIHRENDAVAYVQGNDGMKKFYLDFEYSPLFEKDGLVSGIMITVNDVTQKAEAKQQLQDAEERLRLAAAGTGLATWDLNLQTRHLIYSPRLAEIFGHDGNAVVTHAQLREQLHPDDKQNIVEKAFEKALITGDYLYEARMFWADKSIHWIRTQGKVIFDENNQPVRMLGTMRDVTAEKNHEESMQRLAAIVQSSDDAIISKRIDSIITSWNDAAQRMFNYTAEEIIGQSVLKLIPEDKQDEELEIINRLKKGERIDHFETRRITKDKQLLDISLTVSPLKNAAGEVIGASKIIRDITRQKEAEKLIQENEQKFRLLADSMPQFIWTGDQKGNLTYFNKTLFDYSGLNAAQMNKEGWLQTIYAEDREDTIRQWMQSVQTGEAFLLEHRFRRQDGEYRWQLSRAVPQKDETGNIQMWVGTSTDIDDIKKHDQQKDDFIKMASHELKTPVTTIKGYIQLLLKMHGDDKDPFLANSLSTIDKQIFKLTKLITDLLDVTKIETGSLELNKEIFPLGDMATEIAQQLETTSQTHRITVRRHANPNLYADKDRISQVLINLFTNAIKYSPGASEIIVDVRTDKNNAMISVQDFGIGISQQDRSRIFERFYRAAGKDEKTFPGFGIGLFIVNEIVQLHKGKVWVESEKDKGSVFYVSLPLENN